MEMPQVRQDAHSSLTSYLQPQHPENVSPWPGPKAVNAAGATMEKSKFFWLPSQDITLDCLNGELSFLPQTVGCHRDPSSPDRYPESQKTL